MVPPHGDTGNVAIPISIVPAKPCHVVYDKVPEDRHPDLEWYREWDVIQNAKAWREQSNLALRDRAPAQTGRLGKFASKFALFEDGGLNKGHEIQLGGDEPVIGWRKWFTRAMKAVCQP